MLYDTAVLQTKHRKNYLLFGSGSSKLYSFDSNTSQKSSDHLNHQTQEKKAFSALGESVDGPAVPEDVLTVTGIRGSHRST